MCSAWEVDLHNIWLWIQWCLRVYALPRVFVSVVEMVCDSCIVNLMIQSGWDPACGQSTCGSIVHCSCFGLGQLVHSYMCISAPVLVSWRVLIPGMSEGLLVVRWSSMADGCTPPSHQLWAFLLPANTSSCLDAGELVLKEISDDVT